MDVKVDLGDNTTRLIEQLATQLNMTATEVFPWYVEAVRISALIHTFLFVAVFIVLIYFCRKCLRNASNEREVKAVTSIIFLWVSGGVLTLMLICLVLAGANIIAQIITPEPWAISHLLNDARKLIGK